ncbi:MAG: hypothetical protein U0166_29790 [Acidobacteriota bacterium]
MKVPMGMCFGSGPSPEPTGLSRGRIEWVDAPGAEGRRVVSRSVKAGTSGGTFEIRELKDAK